MCLSAEIARGEGLQRAGGYEPARMLGMGNPKENTRGKCTARGKALRAVLMSELKSLCGNSCSIRASSIFAHVVIS
jgi:hypothetical protein